ncbi:hypothetical protein J25TS5_28290 [Paenibacillus faecis]|nr:hypothetical protein J25TS5_28290 [Paenibacillus faecis]
MAVRNSGILRRYIVSIKLPGENSGQKEAYFWAEGPSVALKLIWVLPTRNHSCRPPNSGLLDSYFNPICVFGKNSG